MFESRQSRKSGKLRTRSELMAQIRGLQRWNAKYRQEIEAFKNGFQGGCLTCETVAERNVELEAALKSIVDTAPVNGEDCSYLLAKSALIPR